MYDLYGHYLIYAEIMEIVQEQRKSSFQET